MPEGHANSVTQAFLQLTPFRFSRAVGKACGKQTAAGYTCLYALRTDPPAAN